jgi:hypothetical protein
MDRLALAKRLREKCGVAGTGPITTIGQVGDALRLVNCIDDAWEEIQLRSRWWRWMRRSASFNTVANKGAYLHTATAGETGITDFAEWRIDTLRCWNTAAGRNDEQFLVNWAYDVWRNTYDFGGQVSVRGRPVVWTQRDEDQAIILADVPDGVYTVAGQYQSIPQVLVADTDVPRMPPRFHMAIVGRAMMLYAEYEAAPEVYSAGAGIYDRYYAELENDQLDPMSMAGPLA